MSGTKGKTRNTTTNPLELGRETVRSLRKQAVKKLGEETSINAQTFLEQLLGINVKNKQETPADSTQSNTPENTQANTGAVEVFSFLKHQDAAPDRAPRPQIEAAMNYHKDIVKSRENTSKGELNEMKHNIEQIKTELSRLIASSHILKLEFAEVAVENTPNVGQYHLNFFEWMLAVIRAAREKVEDSGAWLGTVQGKNAKRGYWGMFKKHGTTFGLSGERAVATQVG